MSFLSKAEYSDPFTLTMHEDDESRVINEDSESEGINEGANETPQGTTSDAEFPAGFQLKGATYTRLADDRSGKVKPRGQRSPIWNYGELYLREGSEERVFYCTLCALRGLSQRLFVYGQGSSHIMTHLKTVHRVLLVDSTNSSRASTPPVSVIDLQRRAAVQMLSGRGRIGVINRFKELIIYQVIFCYFAFFQVENPHFRRLITFLNEPLGRPPPGGVQTC